MAKSRGAQLGAKVVEDFLQFRLKCDKGRQGPQRRVVDDELRHAALGVIDNELLPSPSVKFARQAQRLFKLGLGVGQALARWHGQLEITQYEFVGEQPEGCIFKPAGTINAGFGSAGSLIPPYEYHTIRNPSADTLAVSLHVYKGEMRSCCVFHPLGGELYERRQRELAFDTSH